MVEFAFQQRLNEHREEGNAEHHLDVDDVLQIYRRYREVGLQMR